MTIRWQWFDECVNDDGERDAGLEMADEHIAALYPLVELVPVDGPRVAFAWRVEDGKGLIPAKVGRA